MRSLPGPVPNGGTIIKSFSVFLCFQSTFLEWGMDMDHFRMHSHALVKVHLEFQPFKTTFMGNQRTVHLQKGKQILGRSKLHTSTVYMKSLKNSLCFSTRTVLTCIILGLTRDKHNVINVIFEKCRHRNNLLSSKEGMGEVCFSTIRTQFQLGSVALFGKISNYIRPFS